MWKNRNFTLLTFGNFVSRVGNSIYSIAISWWLATTFSGALEVGYVLSATALGNVIVSPIAGVLIDKVRKKNAIVVCDLISGLLMLIVSFLVYTDYTNIFPYVIISLLLGIISSFFKPAIKTIIPIIIKNESELIKANSINDNIGAISKIIGPSIAAIFFNFKSAAFLITFVNAISFILSAISEMFIVTDEKIHTEVIENKFINNLVDGIKYMYSHKLIYYSIAYISIINIFISSFDVLSPVYINNIKGLDGKFYSQFMLAYSVGAIATMLYTMLKKEIVIDINMVVGPLIIFAFGLLLMALSTDSMILLICAFLLGFSISLFNSVFFANIQKKCDKEYLGRVFSLVFTMALLFTPPAMLIFGKLGEISITKSFLVSGISIIIISLIYRYLYIANEQKITVE